MSLCSSGCMGNKLLVVSPHASRIQDRFLLARANMLYGLKSHQKKDEALKGLKKDVVFTSGYSAASKYLRDTYFCEQESCYTPVRHSIRQNTICALIEESGYERENIHFHTILEEYGFAPDNREMHLEMFRKHFSRLDDGQSYVSMMSWLHAFEEVDKYYISPYRTPTQEVQEDYKIVWDHTRAESQLDGPLCDLYRQLHKEFLQDS